MPKKGAGDLLKVGKKRGGLKADTGNDSRGVKEPS